MMGDTGPAPERTVDLLANPVLIGGLQIVSGGSEYTLGAVLLATPDPVLLTNIAGALLVAHGTDSLAAGFAGLGTQTVQQTYSAQAGEAVATKLGAPPPVVRMAGVAADMAPSVFATELVGASKLATAVSSGNSASRLARIPSPTPGAFTWAHPSAVATSEIIVPIPRAAHLAEDVADLYEIAQYIADARGSRVVPLDQIANYPQASRVVFFGHANQFTLGGLTAEDLNSVLVNAGLRPDAIEFAGCSSGAPATLMESVAARLLSGARQPLLPGVTTLSGTETTGYLAPISVGNGPLSPGAFGQWHDLAGGGRLYDDAMQEVLQPPAPGQ